MMRETITAGSAHAMTVITSGQGSAFQRRATTNGGSEHTAGPNVAAPYWVGLKRTGNQFLSYVSDTGVTWTLVGTQTISMTSQIYVGLCLTSHDNSQLATTTTDNVFVTGGVSGGEVKINFQLAGVPTPTGYLADEGAVFADRGNGLSYGWNLSNAANHRDRDNPLAPDQRYDTLAHLQKPGGPYIWEIALPNRRYSIRAVGGDASNGDGTHHVTAEGITLFNGPQPGGANTYLDGTAEVVLADGRLTLTAGANGVNTKLCFLEITPLPDPLSITLTAPATGTVLLAPATVTLAATASTLTGTITKVEFYQGSTKLGEDATEPYTFPWNSIPVGIYALTAKVTNSSNQTATSPASTLSITGPPANGLLGDYFPTMTLAGIPVSRYDATVNFDWGLGNPIAGIGTDAFSVRWSGRVKPQFTESYTFTTESDDGVRLKVNGALVIDKWIDQGPTLWSTTPIQLVAGQFYDVEMEFYENGGGALARLSWASPSQPSQIIPTGRLFPPVPWKLWQKANFTAAQLADPAIGGETADPDSDGISNLLEYAMRMDPWTPTQFDLPTITQSGSLLTVFFKRNTEATDVSTHLELSTNLIGWSTLGITEVIDSTAGSVQTIRATYTIPANTQRLFMRVNTLK